MPEPWNAVRTEPSIRTDEEIVAYHNPFITVFDDRVTFADGGSGTYVRIVEGDGHPGVVALAVCRERVALVRVYRYPTRAWEWGFPRGGAHGPDPRVSVLAELREELGDPPPESVTPLLVVHPNSGLLAGAVQVFRADYATEVADPQDREEVAEVRWVAPAAVRDAILDGSITDAFTIAAFGAAVLAGAVTP